MKLFWNAVAILGPANRRAKAETERSGRSSQRRQAVTQRSR